MRAIRSSLRRPSTAWLLALLLLPACATQSATDRDHVVRVAVCQLQSIDDDRTGNLLRIEQAVAEAAAGGADLVCFPETSILGWVNPNAHAHADSIPGPTTDRLGALAREHGVLIAIGLAERDGDRLHDSVVLLDRDGTLLLRHRKVNILTELMEPPYTPGPMRQMNVVKTPFGRVGLLICADTFKDEIVATVAAQEPDLLIVPYGWAAPDERWPDHGTGLTKVVCRTAQRAGCPVIGTDNVGTISHGPWTGFVYGGQSVVSDRAGTVLAVLADREPEIRIVEVRPGRE